MMSSCYCPEDPPSRTVIKVVSLSTKYYRKGCINLRHYWHYWINAAVLYLVYSLHDE